jgi:hypothetical protein
MPNEAQDLSPGLRETLLGQFRALVRKASPSELELSALARACLKLGVDPGPLYLEAQTQVPRPESFDPLPPLAAVLPHGTQAFSQNIDPTLLSASDETQAYKEGNQEAARQDRESKRPSLPSLPSRHGAPQGAK